MHGVHCGVLLPVILLHTVGLLTGLGGGGGVPMSHVEFKKCQCPLSLVTMSHVISKMLSCRMSILRDAHVAMSNLEIDGHTIGSLPRQP